MPILPECPWYSVSKLLVWLSFTLFNITLVAGNSGIILNYFSIHYVNCRFCKKYNIWSYWKFPNTSKGGKNQCQTTFFVFLLVNQMNHRQTNRPVCSKLWWVCHLVVVVCNNIYLLKKMVAGWLALYGSTRNQRGFNWKLL